MVFKFANNVQAGCFGLIIEASRSVFDVAFPLFALQVLDSRSNIFFSALHIGSGVAMLALSQNKIAVWVESLLYPSFFALGMTYLTLGLSPPSFPVFLLVAGVIGLVTSVASISSSVRIQILSRDKPERSHLNALYRVVGIIARIASPLCIGKILDSSNRTARPEEHVAQSRHTLLLSAVGAGLCLMAITLCLFPNVSSKHEDGHVKRKGVRGTHQSGDASEQWFQICAYCLCVSLPNMAGGLIRSLLAPFLIHKLGAGPIFYSTTHSVAQVSSAFFIIIASRVLQNSGRSSLLRYLIVQSFAMAICAFAVGSCTSPVSAAATFCLMRSLEQSCNLPNSLMLHELCTQESRSPTAADKSLLVHAIALQKGIGSVLKVTVSLLSAASLAHLGVATTIHIAAGICMVGSASLAWIYFQNYHEKVT